MRGIGVAMVACEQFLSAAIALDRGERPVWAAHTHRNRAWHVRQARKERVMASNSSQTATFRPEGR